MSSARKRNLEQNTSEPKAKKAKVARESKTLETSQAENPVYGENTPLVSNLVNDEVDFPRGGGTSFTPFEVKAIQHEGLEEADQALFKEKKHASRKRRKTEGKDLKKAAAEGIRVEHLNYKRLAPGMKVFGQVIAVQPLALIVSLPNQLLAHVPVTNITSQLTAKLEALDEGADEDHDVEMENDLEDSLKESALLPDLVDMFQPGQYVRAVVTAVHTQGSTLGITGSRSRDETEKASRRVELSLIPGKINGTVAKADLKQGFTISAAIQSVEDHGYILDLGLDDVSGFLPLKDAKLHSNGRQLMAAMLIDVAVVKASKNGRTFTCSLDSSLISGHHITEVSNVSSVLPGALAQALVTAILPHGLNLQVLGFLDGTVDEYHLPTRQEDRPQLGDTVLARVLYQVDSSSPRFAMSLAPHIVNMATRQYSASAAGPSSLAEAFPIGTIMDAVEIRRVETERGLIVEVAPGLEGFVHISHVSDDHVPTLSSSTGPWKVGTMHRARVLGYIPFDGMLRLSFRSSVLEQKFLQVSDVVVGEVVKGTIKKLTDSAMFVTLAGSTDGVVWPTHYADITLKHPAKRFRIGASIKCRILVVDPEKNRISLTAKKTLVESTLPIVSAWDDLKVGTVTHAVVFKVAPRSLQVEFFNNLKAIVPIKEASETAVTSLPDVFPIGKPVKVRIISVDVQERKIVASIRQSSSHFESTISDVSVVDVGNVVEGIIFDIHKDNVVLTLQPTNIRALLSLNNLANRQRTSVPHLRTSLEKGQLLQDLLVVSRNIEKGLVIVASKPKANEPSLHKGSVSWDSVEVGQTVSGRVVGHSRQGTTVKLGSNISASLHPTDASDDYEKGNAFPAVDTLLKGVIVAADKDKRQLSISTRLSRVAPVDGLAIVDQEFSGIDQLKVGDSVRGFVKSVANHGLFVYVGRGIDARVQIKELFDDYVKDWQARFQVNQLVKGRIQSVDASKNQLEMTFRSTDRPSSSGKLQLSDLTEGQKIRGFVKKVEDYGLFIQLDDSKLSGLCHKSELSDNPQADVTLALRSFQEGDALKVVILSIDREKRRISLGLKPSYFDDSDIVADDDDVEDQSLGVLDTAAASVDDDMDEDEDAATNVPVSDDNSEVVDEDDGDEVVLLTPQSISVTQAAGATPAATSVASLQLGTGFQWSAPVDQALADGSEDSEIGSGDEAGTTHRKKRKSKAIEHDLTAEMHTKTPQSIADFERSLLGSPNSSYLWLQYMSFQLQLAEVDKAREVARRALRTIGFREEKEKLNVWIAMLNLENTYGTPETLESTFKEAARANDSKTIHLRLAAILDQSGEAQRAEDHYWRTCKKFGQSSKAWTLFGEFFMQHGKLEDARKLLSRSLQSLEKRKHLKTIARFAQMEYKLGEPERGRTVFEGIVDSHPKRLDLWSIYIDMESTQGNLMSIRSLFERVLGQKMTSHKAKALFKKWLDIERRLGDEDGEELVKQKAIAWTQQASSSS